MFVLTGGHLALVFFPSFQLQGKILFSIDKVFHGYLDEDTQSFCSSQHAARVRTMQYHTK